MEKILALMLAGFLMVSCSSSSQDEGDSELDEVSSDADVVEETSDEASKSDSDLSEIGELEGVDEQKTEEGTVGDSSGTPSMADNSGSGEMAAPAVGGESGSYTVQRGDTLMKIAFKMTGDVSRWQEIHNMNRDKISNPNVIEIGMNLQVPQNGFVDNRSGNTYVVQHGDTLGKISTQIYGNISKWRELYEHNQVLIKDPNKIYSGFTLFYEGSPLVQGGPADRTSASVAAPAAPAAAPAPAKNDEELPMDGVETPDVQGEPATN